MSLGGRVWALWGLVALARCTTPPQAPHDASAADLGPIDAASDVASDRRTVARPGAPIDPARYDCRARGEAPRRVSAVPASCALDPRCRVPQVIGHRGAGGSLGYLAPEDSLSGYRAAIALGVELVETDPRLTADGVLVNHHDPDLARTTAGSGLVAEQSYAALRALSLRAEGFEGDFSCEHIATLEEVLRLCRGHAVVVVDANKTDRVDLLVAAIRAADAVEWVTFSTSDVDKALRARAMLPGLALHIRPRSVEEIAPQLARLGGELPVIVELGRSDVALGAPIVHRAGSRVSTNVFVEDVFAATTGVTSSYVTALDEGADIVQSDRPVQVREAFERAGRRAPTRP
ncbi:MAG: glycerophosphodiester phosphodiesterase family protein [Myxococcales bacterium]|nr:glycerophosphodiester phosphodiesterase family protein [Myxococcales bacterium]